MKKVEIKNYQHEKGQFMAANGAEFTVKEIIPQDRKAHTSSATHPTPKNWSI